MDSQSSLPSFRVENQNGDSANKFDRRDAVFGMVTSALGGPVSPNFFHVRDFVPPVIHKLRVRPAAHLITEEQLAKFEEAVEKMKRLEPNDPRNFYQQADVHRAYCTNAYKQEGFPKVNFQVHWDWLFMPFHRCYLYFYERILGHLINDPDFAIPFWNWDAIPGMQMPAIFNNPNSPLYDELRNASHRPPKLVDLSYDGNTEDPPYDVLFSNLRLMYRQMMINGKTVNGFLGQPLRAGDEAAKTGMGSIEDCPHNNVHDWGGDPNFKDRKDLGNFATAGRDPLFFGHHGNVDRMWNIWQKLGNGKRRDFTDRDWLDSSFVFYDENKNAIRIKVRDCLDSERLGYVYQDVDIPWLKTKPIPFQQPQLKMIPKRSLLREASSNVQAPPVSFPVVLSSKISTVVKRPKTSRSDKEKEEEEEVLVIEDIQFDTTTRVHFNVLVNILDDDHTYVSPANTEFAGSFRNVLHDHKHHAKTSLGLALTELIEDLGLDNDETVFVTLVSKLGGDAVTIGGIKIELQPIN